MNQLNGAISNQTSSDTVPTINSSFQTTGVTAATSLPRTSLGSKITSFLGGPQQRSQISGIFQTLPQTTVSPVKTAVTTSTVQAAQGRSSQTDFLIILFAIIIGWILVALWTRVIENFSYGTLGLNERSTWQAFLVAIFVTLIFTIGIVLVDQYNLVPGGVIEDIESQTNVIS